MTAKEIWYVWDKRAVISGAKKLLFDNGFALDLGEGSSPLGEVFDDKDNFVAYTLGERRERVDCFTCFNRSRYADITDKSGCPDCQGRGYIWKMRSE